MYRISRCFEVHVLALLMSYQLICGKLSKPYCAMRGQQGMLQQRENGLKWMYE